MSTPAASSIHRTRVIALIAVIAATVLAPAASAVTSSVTVVAPSQTVAGRTYAQWLAKWWQVRLRIPGSGSVCQHVGRVELLIGPTRPTEIDRCSIRRGQPLYVNGPSSECSTIEPPPSHGNTGGELRRCARRGFAGLKGTRITIDGKSLRHMQRWVVASGVYRLRLPRQNFFGRGKRSGRSAAYGAGFLLSNLSSGEHVIHETGNEGPAHLDLTYRIAVRP
jgi:hypothetical protein